MLKDEGSRVKRARAKKTGTAPSRKPVKAGTKTAKRAPRGAPEPGRTLVIVESPSKARTLGKILGKGYDIQSSVGHIRDLPKSRLAIDVDNGFEPEYILVRGKGAVVRNLKERASVSGRVLIASDPDREGGGHSVASLRNAGRRPRLSLQGEDVRDHPEGRQGGL